MTSVNAEAAHCGTIVFEESQTVAFPTPEDPDHTITKTPGEWTPDERLARALPEGFSLKFDCYVGADNVRHIIFRYGYEGLMDVGAVGGLPFLLDQCGLEEVEPRLYSDLLLAHQRTRGREYDERRGSRKHLTRKFKYSRDLFLRQNCRPASDQRNILPDTILREKQGKLEKMTVRQLIENGRQAVENGIASSPVGGQPIPEGFYQEAVDNPLELDGEEVRALVLRTLYDFDPANAPSEEIVGFVRERLAAAVDAHRDDTYAAFVDWFAGRKSSFVKQIAKQKKMPGGVLTNAEVNQALLALTIEAYQQMARCIDALMQAFKNSMPVPLSAQENTLFEQMYESQPYYGGFPAAFLAERMNFLKPAVLAIWNEPENEDCKHVLYRMFSYYAEMARTRREADRRSKRTDGRPQPWIENLHGEARPAEETRFDLIGDHIREVHGITCDSGCLQWGSRLVKQTEESVTIGIRCECGNSDRSLEMSIDEFTRCAECALEQTSLASSSNGIGSG